MELITNGRNEYMCEKCGQTTDDWSSAYMLVHCCLNRDWIPFYKKEYEEEKAIYGEQVMKVNRKPLIHDIKPPTLDN